MERSAVISQLKRYFDIRELVSQNVYRLLGEQSWGLFDTRLLEVLLALRTKILNTPMVVNNWASGGSLSQRGYRENTCQLVRDKTMAGTLYLTTHMGMAVDFSSPRMSADEMRKVINSKKNLLPHPIRLENGKDAPTWVHVDVRVNDAVKNKISMF